MLDALTGAAGGRELRASPEMVKLIKGATGKVEREAKRRLAHHSAGNPRTRVA